MDNFVKPEEWLPEPTVDSVGGYIAHTLLGGCVSDVFSEIEKLKDYGYPKDCLNEMAICYIVDQITFQCAGCGWWCEAGDYNTEMCDETGEDYCSQCGEYDD